MQYTSRGLASLKVCAFVALLTLGAGCSSDSDDKGKGEQAGAGTAGKAGSGGNGSTPGGALCGTAKCPAGQYCVDQVACTPGCTSNDDCGADQVCGSIDDVTHVGTCEDVPMKDCAGYLKKCEACSGGELCTQQVCDALTLECVNCIASASCDGSDACACD